MEIKYLLPRGTTAQNESYAGKNGELTLDEERHQLRIHDGKTFGGYPVVSFPEAPLTDTADGLFLRQHQQWVDVAAAFATGVQVDGGDMFYDVRFPDEYFFFGWGAPRQVFIEEIPTDLTSLPAFADRIHAVGADGQILVRPVGSSDRDHLRLLDIDGNQLLNIDTGWGNSILHADLDGEGNIYAYHQINTNQADSAISTPRITKFDPTGVELWEVSLPTGTLSYESYNLQSLHVTGDGKLFASMYDTGTLAADTTAAKTHVLDTADGTVLASAVFPHTVGGTEAGTSWFASTQDNRYYVITYITTGGMVLREVDGQLNILNELTLPAGYPSAFTVTPNDELLVTSTGDLGAVKYDKALTAIWTFTDPDDTAGFSGIAESTTALLASRAGANDALYVMDPTTGEVLTSYPMGGSGSVVAYESRWQWWATP